jgi:signal transduction histidine kinase
MKWIILLAGIANLIFACLIIRKAPSTYFKYYFSIFIFIAVAWIFSNFALINFLSFFWLRTAYALGALAVSAALVWVISFKNEQKPLSPIFLGGCYGLGFIFFILCYVNNLFLKDMAIKVAVVHEAYGPFFPIYSAYTIGIMLFLLFRTLQYILIFKGAKKNQAQYIFWGILGYIAVTTLVSLILPLFGCPQFGFLDSPSSLFFIGFTTYAITKHRLMDISVIISRAVAEVLTVLFLGAIYLGLVWFHYNFISSTIGLSFIAWTIAYGILVGQIHQRIRIFIQTTSDKVFLRGKYDYYKELAEVSLQVGEKLSLPSILRILYKTFYDVVEISNPRIFLPVHFTEPERGSKSYVAYDRENFLVRKNGENIRIDDPLIEKLLSTRVPIRNPHDPNRELIVPCLLEDRLIAIFVLGRKLSEDPYTNEDVRLLEVLASQAAMALDHTRSYEKIKVDLEVAERQLSRSQRLASLGTLAAGVTHEIRNPLTVIRSETDRLAKKERNVAALREYRDLVLKHVDRIAGIIQRMLSMAKEKPRKEAEVDLNVMINSALQLISLNSIKLKKELGEVPPVNGDPVGVEEIFVNLIQNAVQAMPGGGTLTLRTYTENGRAVAEISDTGKGIPEEIREKIFDPFFSTRHEGVGLGLSIAYRIIREHGGDIKVSSQAGKGTTFKLSF